MQLELLAPAKNKEIGIAAINCGADALYIAGPSFGAREAAGNSMDEIAELVSYAHRFGAGVYMTVNTILYENELAEAENLIRKAYEIGCDAIIAQDLGILEMDIPPIRLFASTQTDIRTKEKAQWLESLGFERLILERELSIEQIRDIAKHTDADIETFVHGALCVCYSGQCYLSQKLAGRSANRGSCIQACRSRYDLVDSTGNVLLKDRELLSLKDFNASSRIHDLIMAGVSSFKIEGRLKSISYVKNTVRFYRSLLDDFIDTHKGYSRASWGKTEGGFTPDPDKTFNRGYTTLFLDGVRGKWNSEGSSGSRGEFIGKITTSSTYGSETAIRYNGKGSKTLANGDGVCIINAKGNVTGTRVNRCEKDRIYLNGVFNIENGSLLYRNMNIKFEKELENNPPSRTIHAEVKMKNEGGEYVFEAIADNGFEAEVKLTEIEEIKCTELAKDQKRAEESIKRQIEKKSSIFSFSFSGYPDENIPFIPIAGINKIRRTLADRLNKKVCVYYSEMRQERMEKFGENGKKNRKPINGTYLKGAEISYLNNISNSLSEKLYRKNGAENIRMAYEIEEKNDAELMRTKYCIRYQLGICRKNISDRKLESVIKGDLFLRNNGNLLKLVFDCRNCEMIIKG